jgi:hypothetical protein
MSHDCWSTSFHPALINTWCSLDLSPAWFRGERSARAAEARVWFDVLSDEVMMSEAALDNPLRNKMKRLVPALLGGFISLATVDAAAAPLAPPLLPTLIADADEGAAAAEGILSTLLATAAKGAAAAEGILSTLLATAAKGAAVAEGILPPLLAEAILSTLLACAAEGVAFAEGVLSTLLAGAVVEALRLLRAARG